MRIRLSPAILFAVIGVACIGGTALCAEVQAEVPKYDGSAADLSKPVQVYLLMGQSNAVGLGKIASLEEAVKTKKKYQYLVDDAGNWVTRKDVRNVFIMSLKLQHNDWMSVTNRKNLGVEYALGHILGNATDAPVMILKSCIGNRSLGWDLLPPGSEPWEFGGKTIPGYRGTPDNPKGNGEKVVGQWYAGKQYDDDVEGAKQILADLNKYYPGAKSYQLAGFFFWQGEKDSGNASDSERYEFNLVNFIKQLRKDFNAPDSKFVLATLGEAKKNEGGNKGKVTSAQLAVDGNTGKYPEFKGNVACVFSNPYCHGGGGNSHYGGNAETYMDVGEAMARAMLELLPQGGTTSKQSVAALDRSEAEESVETPKGTVAAVDPNIAKAEKLLKTAQMAEEMGQREAAKSFYKTLVEQHPDTEAAKKAAERLKGL